MINKLFGDIKNLSNQQLLEQISALAKDDSLSTKESFTRLDQILQNAKTAAKDTLAGSPFKQLFEIADKLGNAAKFMDKHVHEFWRGGKRAEARKSNSISIRAGSEHFVHANSLCSSGFIDDIYCDFIVLDVFYR